jgi:hemolysin activation/secretion protein
LLGFSPSGLAEQPTPPRLSPAVDPILSQPGRDPQRHVSPSTLPADDARPDIRLPPAPLPSRNHGNRLGSKLKVFVKRIEIIGNTVLDEAEVNEIVMPYENKEVDSDDLEQIRTALTKLYIDKKYINSGAVIPDQEIKDGVIQIRVIEGSLKQIEISGNDRLKSGYVKSRLELGAGPPLNVDELEQQIRVLLDNPLIERINAELKPGRRPGEALMIASVHERTPYQLGTIFDNQIAPSLGSYRGSVYALHRNLSGWGDQFYMQGSFGEGLVNYSFDYRISVNRWDTSVGAWFAHSDTENTEEPFNIIDITSKTDSYGISIAQPIFRSPGKTLTFSTVLERRWAKTFLLGEPFSFSPGVRDGLSSITALRIGQEWIDRSPNQVIALRSTFNVGLDLFDATINRDLPDGRFFAWVGQFQWLRRLPVGQVLVRTDLQLSDDALLPLEKFAVGGMYSVRGYRENQLVRDWGFASSLEYRYPILTELFGPDKIMLAAFFDIGGAWNKAEETPPPKILPSLGLGLLWDPHPKLHGQFYWGWAIKNVRNPEHDPQDLGFHFRLTANVF